MLPNFNRSNSVLLQNQINIVPAVAYSAHTNPYWGSHCAHLAIHVGPNTIYRYACYTSLSDEDGLEDCEMQPCETPSLLSLGWIIFISLLCLAMVVLITFCVLFRIRGRQRFFIRQGGGWLSPLKMTTSSSVFGGAVALQRGRQQEGVFFSRGSNGPSVQMLDDLVASNPSPLHSLAPALSLKQRAYQPLNDRDPLLLNEPDNADEFSGPV